MSTERENLYTKNDQLIAQIYDNLSGENKSEEAISLLLNPNQDLSGLILSYKSRCRCILSIHLDTAKKPWSYYNTHRQEIKNHQPLCSRFQFRWVQC